MSSSSAAMELKVLISVLQSGQVLPNLLNQVNQLSQGLTKLQNQSGVTGLTNQQTQAVQQLGQQGKEATAEMMSLQKAINDVGRAIRFMTGGFLAYQSVRFIKDLADTAARAEVLQTTLHVVARNAGVLTSEVDKLDRQVQAMGITAASSRQSLIQMFQAKLDVTWAPKLARAAQDLAVVSNMNSSATFQRLLLNIQQMDALGLRMMGVVVSRDQAFKKYADQNDTTVKAMTRRQQQEAFMIETHKQLLTLEGAYIASMDNVGKQLLSLERLTESLKQAVGDVLLPAYSAIVRELGYFYEEMIVVAKVFASNRDGAKELAQVIGEWARSLRIAVVDGIQWMLDYEDQIKTVIKWAIELKLALLGLRAIVWLGAGATAFIVFLTNATRAIAAYRAGKIGLLAATELLTVKTVAEGEAVIASAVAQKAATVAAEANAAAQAGLAGTVGTTTVAVRGLSTAWMGLVATLATAAIGYVIYKITTEDAQTAKPLDEQIRDFQAGLAKMGPTMKAFQADKIQEEREAYFLQWRFQNKALVAQIEKETGTGGQYRLPTPDEMADVRAKKAPEPPPVVKEFLKYEEEISKKLQEHAADDTINKALDAIIAKRREIESLTEQAIQAKSQGGGDIYNAAAERIEKANKDLKDMEASFSRIFKADPVRTGLRELRAAMLERMKAADQISSAVGEDAKNQAKGALERAKKAEEGRAQDLVTLYSKVPGKDLTSAIAEVQKQKETLQRQINEDFQTALTEAGRVEFGEKFDFSSGREELAKFGTTVKNFDLYMQALAQSQSTEEVTKSVAQLGRVLKNLSESVTDATLNEFRQKVEEYRKATKGIAGTADIANLALERGRINAEAERTQFAAPVIAQRKERIRAREEPAILATEERLARAKNLGDAETAVLEEQYSQNLISLETYLDARERRLLENAAIERHVADLRLNLQELLAAEERDPDAISAARQQVAQAEKNILDLTIRSEAELGKLRDQRRTGRRDRDKEITEGLLNLQAEVGGEADILAALNYRLEQQFKKYHELILETGEDRIDPRAALMERLTGINERLRNQLASIDRRRQLQESSVVGARGGLEEEQARIGRAGAKIDADQAAGRITSYQAMQLRNQLVLAQLDKDRLELQQKSWELAQLEGEYAIKRLAILEAQKQIQGDAYKEDSEGTQRALMALDALKQAITSGRIAVQDLQQATALAKDKIESYGKELANVFKDGLTNAITDAILNLKNQEGKLLASLNSFADAVKRKIANVYAQAITEKIMQMIPKGIFELPFKLLGVKRDGDGKTATTPLYVTMVKQNEKGGLEANFGESALKPLFVTEVDPQQAGNTVVGSNNVVNTVVNNLGALGSSGGASGFSGLANIGLGFISRFLSGGGRSSGGGGGGLNTDAGGMAEGGTVTGPGTGTSDSIPAMLSAGEHIMPAAKAARFMPLLEGIRLGKILPFATGSIVQSIAIPSIIPHRYAMGGVVTADGGASQVETAAGGGGPLIVQLHPNALDMTMREWLEREVVRQHGRR